MTPVAAKVAWIMLTLTTTPVEMNPEYTVSRWVNVDKETFVGKSECIVRLRALYPKNITRITDSVPPTVPTRFCVAADKAHHLTAIKMVSTVPVKPEPLVKPLPVVVPPTDSQAAKKAEQAEEQQGLKLLRDALQQQVATTPITTPTMEIKKPVVLSTPTKVKAIPTPPVETHLDLKTNYHKP
jgi:hypothetical protein